MDHENVKPERSHIVRVLRERNKNYVTIHNAIAHDRRASLKARGLFFTLMTLPPDWDFSVRGLITILKESKDAVYSALEELIALGYAVKRPLPREKGQFNRIVLVLRENIEDEWPEFLEESTVSQKPDTVSPATDLAPQLNIQEPIIQDLKKRVEREDGLSPLPENAVFKNEEGKNEEDFSQGFPSEQRGLHSTGPAVSKARPIPDDLELIPEMVAWAEENGLATDVELRTEQFLRHQRRHGYTSDDWLAEWKLWMQHPYESKTKLKKAKATVHVKDVFGFYQNCHNKNAKLDQKRIDVISDALKLYSPIEVKKALMGALADPWVTGSPDVTDRKHNDISYILKDSDKIDGFIAICDVGSCEEGYKVQEQMPDFSSQTWTWKIGEKLKNDRKKQFL